MLVWDLIFISCLILALRRIARSWLYPPRAAIVCLIVLCLIVLCLIVLFDCPSLSFIEFEWAGFGAERYVSSFLFTLCLLFYFASSLTTTFIFLLLS